MRNWSDVSTPCKPQRRDIRSDGGHHHTHTHTSDFQHGLPTLSTSEKLALGRISEVNPFAPSCSVSCATNRFCNSSGNSEGLKQLACSSSH